MKAVVAAFNQEKALVGAFSVIVQLCRLIVNSSNGNSVTRKLGFKHFKHRSPAPHISSAKHEPEHTLQIVRPATRGAARAQTIIRHARHVPYRREGEHMCGGTCVVFIEFSNLLGGNVETAIRHNCSDSGL